MNEEIFNEVGLVDVDKRLPSMPMVEPIVSTSQEAEKSDRMLENNKFNDIVHMLQLASHKYAIRKHDFIKYLLRLRQDPEYNDHVFIYEAGSKPSHLEAVRYIETIMPPAGSFYADEKPVPTVFRQNNNIFIDKITTDVSNVKHDTMFWWQPVSDPHLVEALMPLARYVERYDPTTNQYSIGMLQSTVVMAPLPDAKPIIEQNNQTQTENDV